MSGKKNEGWVNCFKDEEGKNVRYIGTFSTGSDHEKITEMQKNKEITRVYEGYSKRDNAVGNLAKDILALEENGEFKVNNLRKVVDVCDEVKIRGGKRLLEIGKLKEALKEREEYFGWRSDDHLWDYKAEKAGFYVVGVSLKEDDEKKVFLSIKKAEKGEDIFENYRKNNIRSGFQIGPYGKEGEVAKRAVRLIREGFINEQAQGEIKLDLRIRELLEKIMRKNKK